MLRNKTLFVIGAGASKEVGLPVGVELAAQARKLLTFKFSFGRIEEGDYEFHREILNFSGADHQKYFSACARIVEAIETADSIDYTIDRFKEDGIFGKIGKAAIVRLITAAERHSKLFIDPAKRNSRTLPQGALTQTWYSILSKILFQGLDTSTVGEVFNNCAIICFNYDRCIEHYFFHELVRSFGISREHAADTVAKLNIWHPYGSIGTLPWPNKSGVSFGDEVDNFALSKEIKTFTEKIENEASLLPLRDATVEADALVFLGFGFNPGNMKLFTPNRYRKAKRVVLATAYKEPKNGTEMIANQIRSLFNATDGSFAYLEVEDMACFDLLTHYRRLLTADA